jgi:hypothetical protein
MAGATANEEAEQAGLAAVSSNGLGFACLGLGNPRFAWDGFVIN